MHFYTIIFYAILHVYSKWYYIKFSYIHNSIQLYTILIDSTPFYSVQCYSIMYNSAQFYTISLWLYYRRSSPSQKSVWKSLQRWSHQIHPHRPPATPSPALLHLQLHQQETLAEAVHGLKAVVGELPHVEGGLLKVWIQQDVLKRKYTNMVVL